MTSFQSEVYDVSSQTTNLGSLLVTDTKERKDMFSNVCDQWALLVRRRFFHFFHFLRLDVPARERWLAVPPAA